MRLPLAQRYCKSSFRPGKFVGTCVTFDLLLAMALHWAAQRRVLDETGLAGRYDIDLTWDAALEGSLDASVPGEAPSIFTAVREQLGLRLEPAKAQIPVLVIDSVAPPAED